MRMSVAKIGNRSAELVLDLLYIEEYSFWLDIKLMFQTLIVLFKKDSTEAFKLGDGGNEYVFEEYVPEQETETEEEQFLKYYLEVYQENNL